MHLNFKRVDLILSLISIKQIKHKETWEDFWKWWICLLPWLWWWVGSSLVSWDRFLFLWSSWIFSIYLSRCICSSSLLWDADLSGLHHWVSLPSCFWLGLLMGIISRILKSKTGSPPPHSSLPWGCCRLVGSFNHRAHCSCQASSHRVLSLVSYIFSLPHLFRPRDV